MHIVVVGGGVIGLLCAMEGTMAGHRVTLFEQDVLPSPLAASFDRHRIARTLHVDDPVLTEAAVRAHHRWIELERITFSRFYDRVGALTVLTRDRLPDALPALWKSGARAEVLEGADLGRAYPHLALGETCAVLEEPAGVLLADRVLTACVAWLRRRSTVALLPGRAVRRIDPDGGVVELAGADPVTADAVIVAAGPWSRELLPAGHARELELHRQSMLLCDLPPAVRRQWAGTPAVPALGTSDGAWLVPPVAGTPLKLSAASACRTVEASQDLGDRRTGHQVREHLISLFSKVIKGFDAGWVTGCADAYYLSCPGSATGRAVVELGRRTVALTACGGGSFKFAPLIARSLVGHVTGAPAGATGGDLAPLPLPAPRAPGRPVSQG